MLDLSSCVGGARLRWIETCALTAAVPVLRLGFGARDPIGWGEGIPWLVLIPLLIAVQHGLAPALFSAAALFGIACGPAIWSAQPLSEVALSWAAACFLAAAIAGQARDMGRRRSSRAELQLGELRERLERMHRNHYTLALSHVRLVEQVSGGQGCLALSLARARRELGRLRGWPEWGPWLLDTLGNNCRIEVGSLYVVQGAQGQLGEMPVAALGSSAAGVAQNALVLRALRSGKLTAVIEPAHAASDGGAVLAAVPLITSAKRVLGVLAIEQMPFIEFQADKLETVFALVGQLADAVWERQCASDTSAARLASSPAAQLSARSEPRAAGSIASAASVRARLGARARGGAPVAVSAADSHDPDVAPLAEVRVKARWGSVG